MRLIDEIYLQSFDCGSRQIRRSLRRIGHIVSRHRVRKLMKIMGIEAVYQKPKTSLPNKQHKIYPYLLTDLPIIKPNKVWCTDITYIPMQLGFIYFVAIMDWYSGKILSYIFSNTLEKEFCIEALKEAIQEYDTLDIFNTDQGS